MDDTSWTRLVDPAATLGAVLAATRPSPGDVVVARVDIESQRVTGNRTLRPRRRRFGSATLGTTTSRPSYDA
jgi:hypothetical protein